MHAIARRLCCAASVFVLLASACSDAPARRVKLPDWPRIAPLHSPERGDVLALDHPGLHLEVGMLSGRAPGQGLRLSRAAAEKAPLVHGLGFGFEHSGQLLPMRIERVEAVAFGARAAVRVRGELARGSVWVRFTRTLTAGDVPGTLSIATELVPRQPDVELVERVAWGKARPFVPGVGIPETDAPVEAPWIGGTSSTATFVVGFAHGPARVRAVFDRHGSDHGLRELRVSALAPEPRARTSRWKSLLVLHDGPLAQALRRFGWARGRPYAELYARLAVQPPESTLRVELPDGRPYLRSAVRDAQAVPVPLPDAEPEVRVFATAAGHAQSPVFTVSRQHGPREVELELPTAGELRVKVRDRKTRKPLAFRMRLEGIEGTAKPVLGPEGRAAGALDSAISTKGELGLHVPPGTYLVRVSHGPEWSLVERRVTIVAGRTRALSLVLSQEADAPGWIGCDLHVHAAPSPDSEVSLDDRLRTLAAEGVAFAVPTDHNHVTDYGPVIQAANHPVLSVPGVEVTTEEPSFGHFNAFPMAVDPESASGGAPVYTGLTPAVLFESLRALDPSLAIQVNHPRLEGGIGYFDQTGYDPRTGAFSGDYADDYDLLEVWNGYDIARAEIVQRNLEEWLAMLQRRARVATGSSDSHTVRGSWAGYPRTYVYVGTEAPADATAVIPALKAGRAFVTNGPILLTTLDGKGPGEHVPAEGSARLLRIEVRTASWMSIDRIEVHQGGVIVHKFDVGAGAANTPRRVSRSVQLEATPGSWVVVVARGSRPLDAFFGRQKVVPLAFTNPIWID